MLATGAPRFANGFVFDDIAVIVDGELIHDPSRLLEAWTGHTMVASASDPGAVQSVDTYRPMPLTSFTLDAAISGRDPWAFHLSSLVLHLLCTLLVWRVGLALLGPGRRGEMLYGAAVFAVHPWSVEAHGWINGRSDPLALAFGLLCLLTLLRAERRGAPAWLRPLAAGAFLLGLLSKETLLTLVPAFVLLPNALRPDEAALPLRARARGRLPALLAASAVYLIARSLVLGGVRTHRDGSMLLEALAHLPTLLFDGLRQLLVPDVPYLRSLRDEYASHAPWQSGLAAAAIVALALLAWRHRRRAPVTAASLAWALLPLVPVAILCTVLWPGFGRYLYLPAAGLAWALAELVSLLGDRLRPTLRAGFGAAHVAVLALLALGFLRDFESDETLYAAAIEARPDVAVGWGWLGMSRAEARPSEAVGPLARAVALDPDTARYRLTLARAALAAGDRARSARTARAGIARHRGTPEAAGFHLAAVNALPRRDPASAVHHLLRCLEVWPGRSDCAASLGQLLEGTERAIHCRHALAEPVVGATRVFVERACGPDPGARPDHRGSQP